MSGFSLPTYVGTYRHTLDAKNRLTIPAKWRVPGDEKDPFMAIPNSRGLILVLPPAEVARIRDWVGAKPIGDPHAFETQHMLFSLAQTFDFDKQGRIGLDAGLLEESGIKREVVLVGTMTKFTIWKPESWAQLDPKQKGYNGFDLISRIGT